jgi:hypothetical protein
MTKRVEIFIGPIACTCAGGPTPARQEKITRAFALKSALESDPTCEVRVWMLGEDADYNEGMRALRRCLEEAGETELAENLAFSLNSATPSVAVDGRLICLADVPAPERFSIDTSTGDDG